ncbi:cellulose synthase BcsB subunit [Kaistia sp. 32K]|uniref:cellulose biosynthesis cyclic di-GMP-binding regulatory protein BcsB n=1 Tax=Kaistia sp. 32K TaxID=2795690 RepID=UPI001916A1E5|nr:cellulose biosynthesis cyclic di-GMP-binding regulatory protein BcsB [Kaistia sp. 32K]BCP54168.1 cellulose synthase BcsB subunit [Kaistia sp. 32K]
MKTLIRTGLAVSLLGSSALWAIAQNASPFDMSGERVDTGAGTATPPPPPPQRAPAGQGAFAPFQLEPTQHSAPAAPAAPQTPIAAPAAPAVTQTPVAAPAASPAPAPQTAPTIVLTPAAPAAPVTEAVDQPAPAQPPAQPAQPSEPAPVVAAATEPAPVENPDSRFIVPSPTLRLEGETDQHSWVIYLAGDQAGQPARLDVSFKNAIVVMPEASLLRVSINNQAVLETALTASDSFRDVAAMIPPGLLQAGANTVRFQVAQRHRTDCTVQSTYELWTEIDGKGTTLTFAPNPQPTQVLRGLDDLPAIGFDGSGVTAIRVIAPGSNQATIAPHLLKLVQALTLAGNYPNPIVTVSDRALEPAGAGVLTVVLGVGSELGSLMQTPPADANSRPIVSFVDEPSLGRSVMVVTGANWTQIGSAIDQIASGVDRPIGVLRKTLNTAPWLAPDVRFVMGRDSFRLLDAGVTTQEFSGRRFRTEFAVGIPSDFYAEAYGEATLRLDAAYTAAVRPASHIDIYVNGQIAATTRITRQQGGIYRQFPIKIPLRHFHPGVNRVSINALLDTAEDAACAPGGSTEGGPRFVLFDTTTFEIGNFARIGRRPDLGAFAGTAAPYNRFTEPSALVMGRTDPKNYSAAASLLARMAIQAGRVIDLAPTPAASVGDRNALFIGAAAQMPGNVLGQLGIAETVRTTWRDETAAGERIATANDFAPLDAVLRRPGTELAQAPASRAEAENTDVTFDRWQNELVGGGWHGQVNALEGWLKRTFDISFSTLSFFSAATPPFEPSAKTTMIIAQSGSPNGEGTWTMVTAPSEDRLVSGIQTVTGIARWPELGGRISTFNATTDAIESRPANQFTFVQTQPFSLGNMRLIAANWLSSNILYYALGLVGLCLVLGIVTTALLRRLGRPS